MGNSLRSFQEKEGICFVYMHWAGEESQQLQQQLRGGLDSLFFFF